jgi:hypothetical protein
MTAAILVVGALLLVPGIGAALAFASPAAISIEARIALAFGLGYGLVAGVATLLALAHVLHRWTFVAAAMVATVAVWTLALRRASARAHVSALATQAREAPYTVGAGLTLLLVVALTRPFYPPATVVGVRSSWRYWADGLEVAEGGHVPTKAAMWGTELPATVSKVVLNSFDGGVSLLLGADPLAPMQGILAFYAVGLVAALLALGRELGLGIFSPLVPTMVVLTPATVPFSHAIAGDLKHFGAEGIGRMAAFCALLAGIHAVRTSSFRWPAIVTGALLAVAGLTHLVPTLVAGAVLLLYGLATTLVDHSAFRRIAMSGIVIAVAFVACYAGAILASRGDLGLQGATSGARVTSLPENLDPIRSFALGREVERQHAQGRFLISPRAILSAFGSRMIAHRFESRYGLLALALLTAASIAAVLAVRKLFVPAFIAWGLVAVILAITLLFSYRYDTLRPANFGIIRLFDYASLAPALLVPVLLVAAARPLTRRAPVAIPVLAVVVALLSVAAALDRTPRDRSLPNAEAGIAVFHRVGDFVPCDARMLANARTAGSWESWTGRRAITEGMSPVLRPAVLERILPILLGANEFFSDPQANRDFLAEQRVQYLIVVEPGVAFGQGGLGRSPAPEDAEKVAALPDVHPVYRDERVSIFSVGSAPAGAQGGQPERCDLDG